MVRSIKAPIKERFKKAWNAFNARDESFNGGYQYIGPGSYSNPDGVRIGCYSEGTIINSIYTRIAIDVASNNIHHVQLDKEGRFKSIVKGGIEDCLNLEANIDQSGKDFIMDTVISMLDEGSIAILPVYTTRDIRDGSFDIYSMRVAKILQWFPEHVQIEAYDEQDGQHKPLIVPKNSVAIINNPLGPIMNEPNSTLKRLVRKLSLLDAIDERNGSSKIDIIVQLPYSVRSEGLEARAEKRRKSLEDQLVNSKYGVAYMDGTEKITQLNRSVDNNLLTQVEYLTKMLYSQLGLTDSIMDGTADEKVMINYQNRTIQPILSAIVDAMKRVWITPTARSQGKTIKYFNNPFRFMTVGDFAEASDKLTRNEIMSSNEVRDVIGYPPSDDPKADQLINSNLNHDKTTIVEEKSIEKKEVENQNGI